MKNRVHRVRLASRAVQITLGCVVASATAGAAAPDWVYPINPPAAGKPAAEAPKKPVHIPNSGVTFMPAQLVDRFVVPDWHPRSHDQMPDIVARGRTPDVFACGYCHLPGGGGRPENASLAGLPSAYIVQQVSDFQSGARRAALKGAYAPTDLMIDLAKHVNTDEVRVAADYFSHQKLRPRVVVLERARIPRTEVMGWVYVTVPGGGDEPLGERLIEIAPDGERHEHRDDRMRYVAYVPPGSISRGRRIAHSGEQGVATACVTCHGARLQGVGPIPPIAGRSPSYLLRQLLAFQSGARASAAGQPMQPVVADLKIGKMIDVVAYAASLQPASNSKESLK